MKLAVVSHKLCWNSPDAPDFYRTDGGFPRQIKAISELFDETRVVVPCERLGGKAGVSPLAGRRLSVAPLSVPKGADWRRKLDIPFWLARNGTIIWREVRRADAVHAPIPGDVGTIGMLLALLLGKPLFVRYCGNWFVQRTAAEAFWHWTMERFAGGRNVVLATGGDSGAPPSAKNANIEWIFSTSLTEREIAAAAARELPPDGKIKLIIACRQEKGKGTEIVIESLALIAAKYPNATLDVVGDGAILGKLKEQAKNAGLTDKIVFHGKVEPPRVMELLKQAHVFCYPTASEGFPKAVLEALACGLPVITTPVSVLPMLVNENCGVVLDRANGESLAAAIENICADPEKYRRMSVAAIAAAKDYSLENWRDRIGAALRKAWRVESLSGGAAPESAQ